ncbi:high choriolytic enzyme 2-like isoform X1 [Polypterus senegalus]|uniref:high choriolytic enzyme 2-like isoform X1 n=2 Tax=Polypterus senegalus TaxID=55291 RepID=UPI0019646E9F|nr:high choriolytic enzyme 2-like isoform X1 [Polypterus senegalus]
MAPGCAALLATTLLCLSHCSPLPGPLKDLLGGREQHAEASATDVFSHILDRNTGSKKLIKQGDMIQVKRRSTLVCPTGGCLWPKLSDGTVSVPYVISDAYSADEAEVILHAMREFHTLTCVRFVSRRSEKDFVQIISNDGCWSSVGRLGGAQELSLAKDGCLIHGVVQHELNHVLGFIHEQCRPDRDTYIKINWQYVNPEDAMNFAKSDLSPLNLPYDYTSIMHYGRYAYSNTTGEAVIVPLVNSTNLLGQRYGMSPIDVRRVNTVYSCRVCTALLSETSGVFISADFPAFTAEDVRCVLLIRVPGRQILLDFEVFIVQESPGCTADSVRVYDGDSIQSPVLLEKTCGSREVSGYYSSTNTLLVEFIRRSLRSPSHFQAKYQMVACGATKTTMSGEFSSENFPTGYPNNHECTWNLIAPPGYKVSITVVSFHLENSPACEFDYVIFWDGFKSTAKMVGKYCGEGPVPFFISTGNVAAVQFHSDKSIRAAGAQFTYAFIH